MITEKDLDDAIASCIGKQSPNANDCIKLASFYTIRDNLYPEVQSMPQRSYASPRVDNLIDYQARSEFADMIDGKEQYEVLSVMDELMETLRVINPRLYNAVMRKLQ